MRPRVQRAPGLPCALLFEGGMNLQNSGKCCREKAEVCVTSLFDESEKSTHVVPASAPGPITPGVGCEGSASTTLPKREHTAYGSRRGGRDDVVMWRSAVRINVIARSTCDEAIQLLSCRPCARLQGRYSPHKIACGTNREVFPVIGFSSSRIDRPQGAWSTSQLPITGYWPENCGSGARA